MIRWIFKWLFRLALLAVVLIVIFILSLNSILRVLIEHNIRAQTGMDAEIGRFKLGLTVPTVEIQDMRIYNPPSFGGTPFLDIREIHAEYDPAALLEKKIHLTLLRFDLAELDIVKSQSGQTNIFSFGGAPRRKPGTAPPPAANFKKQTGYDFAGIDTLNVSFTRAKYIDLRNSRNNREQILGIQDCIVPHVKSTADLTGLLLLIDLRSDHFFDALLAQPKKPSGLQTILNLTGAAL